LSWYRALSAARECEWLALPGWLEVAGAVFHTRLQGVPAFTGRAPESIRRLLANHGARIGASPESFLVQGLTGPWPGANWGTAAECSDRLRGVARRPDAVGCQQRDGAGTPWSRLRARRL